MNRRRGTFPSNMRIGFPLALGVLAAAASVRADDLVACASNDAVFVERISGDQVEAVYQEPALNRFTDQPGALSWGWSDARPLWVLRKVERSAVRRWKAAI